MNPFVLSFISSFLLFFLCSSVRSWTERVGKTNLCHFSICHQTQNPDSLSFRPTSEVSFSCSLEHPPLLRSSACPVFTSASIVPVLPLGVLTPLPPLLDILPRSAPASCHVRAGCFPAKVLRVRALRSLAACRAPACAVKEDRIDYFISSFFYLLSFVSVFVVFLSLSAL